MKKKGKLIVISGFSGVGKGTVIHSLMEDHPEYVFSVSATTRYSREGEIDGVHYFFMTREAFEQNIADDKLLEYAQYNGNYYGTPKDYVFSQMEKGNHVVLDIECQGAFQVKAKYPEALMIFLIPPSIEVLYKRLTGRGTETAEQVRGRMLQSQRELGAVPKYDVILVNDKLDQTVQNILSIMEDPSIGQDFYRENAPLVETFASSLDELLEQI